MSKSSRASSLSLAGTRTPEVQGKQVPEQSPTSRSQDVEVLPKPKRRTFTAKYKAKILAEAPEGVRFLTRSRVFTEAELAALDSSP